MLLQYLYGGFITKSFDLIQLSAVKLYNEFKENKMLKWIINGDCIKGCVYQI